MCRVASHHSSHTAKPHSLMNPGNIGVTAECLVKQKFFTNKDCARNHKTVVNNVFICLWSESFPRIALNRENKMYHEFSSSQKPCSLALAVVCFFFLTSVLNWSTSTVTWLDGGEHRENVPSKLSITRARVERWVKKKLP